MLNQEEDGTHGCVSQSGQEGHASNVIGQHEEIKSQEANADIEHPPGANGQRRLSIENGCLHSQVDTPTEATAIEMSTKGTTSSVRDVWTRNINNSELIETTSHAREDGIPSRNNSESNSYVTSEHGGVATTTESGLDQDGDAVSGDNLCDLTNECKAAGYSYNDCALSGYLYDEDCRTVDHYEDEFHGRNNRADGSEIDNGVANVCPVITPGKTTEDEVSSGPDGHLNTQGNCNDVDRMSTLTAEFDSVAVTSKPDTLDNVSALDSRSSTITDKSSSQEQSDNATQAPTGNGELRGTESDTPQLTDHETQTRKENDETRNPESSSPEQTEHVTQAQKEIEQTRNLDRDSPQQTDHVTQTPKEIDETKNPDSSSPEQTDHVTIAPKEIDETRDIESSSPEQTDHVTHATTEYNETRNFASSSLEQTDHVAQRPQENDETRDTENSSQEQTDHVAQTPQENDESRDPENVPSEQTDHVTKTPTQNDETNTLNNSLGHNSDEQSDSKERSLEDYREIHGMDGKVIRILDVGYELEYLQRLLADAISCMTSIDDVILIIRCGGQLDEPVQKGLRPIHYAAYVNNTEATDFLLNYGADINAVDEVGCTALHICARKGHVETMELLIQRGACINFCDATEDSPESYKSLGYLTLDPLNIAIENNNVNCVRLLLAQGANPNHKYFMGYEINMVPMENIECLEALLGAGANTNVFNRCGTSPLMKACKCQNIEAARLLLKFGADINLVCPPLFEQRTALHYCVEGGSIGMTHMLLRYGASTTKPESARYACIHMSVIKDHPEMCELLMKWDADVDERSDEKATSLQLACSAPGLTNRKQLIEILLNHGANPNFYQEKVSFIDPYLTPMVEYLKNAGNDVSIEIVHLLLRHGSRLVFREVRTAMRSKDRFSVLEFVPEFGGENMEVLHLLMEAASAISLEGVLKYMTKLRYVQKRILFENSRNPVPLMHMARRAVRGSLKPGKFQEGIWLLPLPDAMKDFLVFDCHIDR